MSGLTKALRILGYNAQEGAGRRRRVDVVGRRRGRAAAGAAGCRGEHGRGDRSPTGSADGPRRLDEGGPGGEHIVDDEALALREEHPAGSGRAEGAPEVGGAGGRVETRLIGDPAADLEEVGRPICRATRGVPDGRRDELAQRRVPAAPTRSR